MSKEGVCRTAPATLGLLTMQPHTNCAIIHRLCNNTKILHEVDTESLDVCGKYQRIVPTLFEQKSSVHGVLVAVGGDKHTTNHKHTDITTVQSNTSPAQPHKNCETI